MPGEEENLCCTKPLKSSDHVTTLMYYLYSNILTDHQFSHNWEVENESRESIFNFESLGRVFWIQDLKLGHLEYAHVRRRRALQEGDGDLVGVVYQASGCHRRFTWNSSLHIFLILLPYE